MGRRLSRAMPTVAVVVAIRRGRLWLWAAWGPWCAGRRRWPVRRPVGGHVPKGRPRPVPACARRSAVPATPCGGRSSASPNTSAYFARSSFTVIRLMRGDLFSNIQVHAFLLVSGSREPLTTMDTEHGFLGNLKAGWTGIRRFFRPGLSPESAARAWSRRTPAARMAGHFGKTLVGRQRRRIVE